MPGSLSKMFPERAATCVACCSVFKITNMRKMNVEELDIIVTIVHHRVFADDIAPPRSTTAGPTWSTW